MWPPGIEKDTKADHFRLESRANAVISGFPFLKPGSTIRVPIRL
jgi:hypothetical protein